MALHQHSATATGAGSRKARGTSSPPAVVPAASPRQDTSTRKSCRSIHCTAQIGGDAFGGLIKRVSGPPKTRLPQQQQQPAKVTADTPALDGSLGSSGPVPRNPEEQATTSNQLRRRSRSSSISPLRQQQQDSDPTANNSTNHNESHTRSDTVSSQLTATVQTPVRRRRRPLLRTITPVDVQQWTTPLPGISSTSDGSSVSAAGADAAVRPSETGPAVDTPSPSPSTESPPADGAETAPFAGSSTAISSRGKVKASDKPSPVGVGRAAGASLAPKVASLTPQATDSSSSSASATGWVPKGPDVKADATNQSASDKAQKANSRSWVNSWGKASPTSTSMAGKGNLFSKTASTGSTSRAAHNRNMLQSWGDSLGPSSQSGPGVTGSGPGGTAQVLATGPRLEQTHTGAWQLLGCDSELAELPRNVAGLQGRLAAAIKAEQEAEAAALSALYSRTNVSKLQKEGVVLAGLRAKPGGELYRNIIWHFSKPAAGHISGGRNGAQRGEDGSALPYHKFRQGDSVLVSRFAEGNAAASAPPIARKRFMTTSDEDSTDDDDMDVGAWFVEGTVLEVKRTYLAIALERKDSQRFEAHAALWGRGPGGTAAVQWRLDTSVRDVTATRQREALGRLGQWHGTGSITTHRPPAGGEALVRLALTASSTAVPLLAEQPPAWVRNIEWREGAKSLLAAQNNLNDSQRRAVATAMVRSLTLWQGPPGTGKTRTLLALIAVLVGTSARSRNSWAAMGPLLACADTNAAVDNIVEGLLTRGLRVVRVGNPAKVRPALRHVTSEALAEKDTAAGRESARIRHAAQEKLEAVRVARDQATGTTPLGVIERWAATEVSARSELARADQLLKTAMEEVLCTAQVVCATCAGAGDAMLASHTFKVVVIDEASQATEPATLVPLTRGAQCVVMAGDPRQLPPTVTSRKALEYKLDVTLFDRLSNTGLNPLLLDTQYRMHTALSAFPSMHFYARRLQDGVKDNHGKPVPRGIAWPKPGLPVVFLQVFGQEERASVIGGPTAVAAEADGEGAAAGSRGHKKTTNAGEGAGGASYRNREEALAAMQALELLVSGGDVSSVALLTPYKGQVRALEALLRQLPERVRSLIDNGALEVTVSSVDGFQGREADAVIFTAVRSNPRRTIGFVADPRRLNVAITRPKRGLVVLGDDTTLAAGSSDWRAYVGWLRDKGLVVPAESVLGHSEPAVQHAVQLSSDDECEAGGSDVQQPPARKARSLSARPHVDKPRIT